MKKILLSVLLVTMIISLVACGGEKGSVVSNKNNNTTNNVEKKKTSYEKASYLTNTYNEPFCNFYIDTPNYQSFVEASSQMWNVDGQFFIIVAAYRNSWDDLYKIKKEEIKTVEDIITGLKKPIIASSKNEANAKIEDLIVTKKEKVTINGREMCRFEGYFDCDTIKNRFVVGYTLFYKDQPMYLIGVNSHREQEQSYTTEVTKNVDDMIKTLRDTE